MTVHGCGVRLLHDAAVSDYVQLFLSNPGDEDLLLLAEDRDFQHNRCYERRPALSKVLITNATAAFEALAQTKV